MTDLIPIALQNIYMAGMIMTGMILYAMCEENKVEPDYAVPGIFLGSLLWFLVLPIIGVISFVIWRQER